MIYLTRYVSIIPSWSSTCHNDGSIIYVSYLHIYASHLHIYAFGYWCIILTYLCSYSGRCCNEGSIIFYNTMLYFLYTCYLNTLVIYFQGNAHTHTHTFIVIMREARNASALFLNHNIVLQAYSSVYHLCKKINHNVGILSR